MFSSLLRMSNCWLWARKMAQRRVSAGYEGYFVKRKSRWATKWVKFPHFLYAERRASGTFRVVSYVPKYPKRRIVPPPLFRGRVKWGDKP